MSIDQDEVIKILKLLDESDFEELDLQMGDLKLSVRKSGTGLPMVNQKTPPVTVSPDLHSPEKPTQPEVDNVTEASTQIKTETGQSELKLPDEDGLIPVRSPMIGVFYRRAKPESPPFVEVGSRVEENDTLCLIEVMKTFTSVSAGVKGVVAKICAESAELVEYQQTIFLIKPDD